MRVKKKIGQMGEKWVRSTAPAGAASVPQSLTAAEAALDRASGGGRAPGGAGPAAGNGAEGRGAGAPRSYLLHREAASLLGISQTAVTTRLQRARKKLRERLEEEGRP